MNTESNTFMNALAGALTTSVLAYLPFSPILGGALSGYLEREGSVPGAKAGFLSGVLVFFPLFGLMAIVVPLFLIAPFGVLFVPIHPVVFAIGLFLGTTWYAVTLSTLGGFVGGYLSADGA